MKELAAALDAPIASIYRHVKAGRIPRQEDGSFETGAVCWALEQLDGGKAPPPAQAPASEPGLGPGPAGTNGAVVLGTGSKNDPVVPRVAVQEELGFREDDEARKTRLQADKLEFELKVAQGQYVDLEQFVGRVAKANVQVAQRLMALARELPPALEMRTAGEIQNVLSAKVREVLANMARPEEWREVIKAGIKVAADA